MVDAKLLLSSNSFRNVAINLHAYEVFEGEFNGCSPTLKDIPLLKTLGYDFEFSNWTGLSAIRQRAERDEAVFRALHHSLRARSKHVGDKVKTEQGASLVFTSSIREVARKVHVCAMIMAVVVFRANRQRWELSEHVDSVHTAPNAQLEGESCFVPGRRIIFTHDTEEMWKTRKVYGATLADE